MSCKDGSSCDKFSLSLSSFRAIAKCQVTTHVVRGGNRHGPTNEHEEVVGRGDDNPDEEADKMSLVVESDAIIAKPRTMV
jgi:hypothetical protein